MRLLNNAANILGSSALQNELFKTSCKKPREIKKKHVNQYFTGNFIVKHLPISHLFLFVCT